MVTNRIAVRVVSAARLVFAVMLALTLRSFAVCSPEGSDDDGPTTPTFPCQSMTTAEICAAAAVPSISGGDAAGVVCCSTKKMPCVWLQNFHPILPSSPGGKKALGFFESCMIAHEQAHISEGSTCGTPDSNGLSRGQSVSQPGMTQDEFIRAQDRKECHHYLDQIACLKAREAECEGDQQCIQQLLFYIAFTCNSAYSVPNPNGGGKLGACRKPKPNDDQGNPIPMPNPPPACLDLS